MQELRELRKAVICSKCGKSNVKINLYINNIPICDDCLKCEDGIKGILKYDSFILRKGIIKK